MTRNISLDILKLILAFCIIALHGKIFQDINPELTFFLVNGIFRVGVPVFLLVTGFYFLYIKDIKIWLKRVSILYAFWMIFYAYFYIEPPTTIGHLAKDLILIFFGYHHLWYLAGTLLGGVLLWYAKDKSTRFQISSAISLFLLGVTLQYIGNTHVFNGFLDKLLNVYAVHRNFLTVCYPFLMLGYLINKLKITEKIVKPWAWLTLSVLILYSETYINYKFISKSESLDGMYSLLIICPLLFICFFRLNFQGQGKYIALLSTALYLIHPLFQNLLANIGINSMQVYFLTVVLSLIASIFLIIINRKLKFII